VTAIAILPHQKARPGPVEAGTEPLTTTRRKGHVMATQRICAVEGCGGLVVARGWCRKHYSRWDRHGDLKNPPSTEDRFWPRVDKTSHAGGCWLWTGSKFRTGYGRATQMCKPVSAHRLSYIINVGPIPSGRLILHSCDNRACVNPSHLRIGTHADNVADMVARGRNKLCGKCDSGFGRPGESNGQSKLTKEAVAEIRSTTGQTKSLARKYGVHTGTIQAARSGKWWKSLTPPEPTT
jgi:hypothetical protein